jgi:signal transduction histidine kinase
MDSIKSTNWTSQVPAASLPHFSILKRTVFSNPMNSNQVNGLWNIDLEKSSHPMANSISSENMKSADRENQSLSQRRRSKARFVRKTIRPYGTAILLVGSAFVLTFILRYFFPYPVLFLFFAAVMVSAWLGGTGAGLFAVLLSTLVTDYFFVPPFDSFVIDATNVSYFGAFVLCALVASWVSTSKKKTEEALREARDHLELKVAERTAALEKSNTELRRTMHDHEEAQQALRQTQTELAHLSRALTMGELTSSIAHEINQPLTAVVTHGHACVEWLSANPPDLAKARQTAKRIIEDGTRAGTVLRRIRALFSKQGNMRDWVDMNEVITELTVFLRDEAVSQRVSIRTELAPELPRIKCDRVQLQQVVLNLMMNGMDAMRSIAGECMRELLVRSKQEDQREIVISVEDSGCGLSPQIADKIFEPFFTTKPEGIGMGLSISRSIIESHGGRICVRSRPLGGTIASFTVLVNSKSYG